MKNFAVSSLTLSIVAAGVAIAASPLAVSARALDLRARVLDGATQTPTPTAGTIVTGKITFDGKRPEAKPLTATPEQQKGCCPEGKSVNVLDPTLILDEKGGIANVLVTIEANGAELVVPKDPIVLDQRQCVFEPHCTIAPAGAKVVFLNSDNVSHNVHVYAAKNDAFNDTIAAGAKKEVVFSKAEKIQLKCDIHPWMSSYLFVVDTPYAALSKADGTFSISGLKPGTYKLKLWHEVLGRGEAQTIVKDDGTCAPIEVKMGEPKKKN